MTRYNKCQCTVIIPLPTGASSDAHTASSVYVQLFQMPLAHHDDTCQ